MSENTPFFARTHSFDTAERLYNVGTVKKVSASINQQTEMTSGQRSRWLPGAAC